MKDPNAAEGETKFIVGSLEDVLKQAAPGSVIYLQTPRVLEIEGYTVEQLEAFDIRPDDGMFSGGVVLISSSDPREEYDPDAPGGRNRVRLGGRGRQLAAARRGAERDERKLCGERMEQRRAGVPAFRHSGRLGLHLCGLHQRRNL